MSAEFDKRVRELFDLACERPSADRTYFLKGACQGNQNLYQAVERLLLAHNDASSFMNSAVRPVRRIGRYLIQAELGRGGMGIVYDAMDPVIGRNVAVKVINLKAISQPSDAEFLRERLFREARSCGKLLHPGIVVIFDVGQEEESAFIAMERVDGPSLHQLLVSGKSFPPAEVVKIIQQAAAALDYAHLNGIVHRDIKPANVMLRPDGVVKVTDFGIAKVITSASTTVTGAVMGTPSYMSPEQIEGREVSGRSDQFSLAVLAYEILTRARPFPGDSIASIVHLIMYGPRPSPRTMNSALPGALDPVFERAFSRLPEERYPSCAAFADALHSIFEPPSPSRAPRPAPVTVLRLPEPKKRAGKSSGVLAVAALLVVAAGSAFFYSKHADAPPTTPLPTPLAESKPPASPTPSPQHNSLVKPDAPPVIKQFRADPDSIKTGTPAMLIWEVNGADIVSIDHGIGKVSAKGMFAVVPTVTTTYAITAVAAAGATHRSALIDVKADPDSVPASVRARQFFTAAQSKRHDGQAEDAAALFGRAAELGDTAAMVELGEIYSAGDGVTEDEAKALVWFKRAAEAGNVSGMVAVGGMYSLGTDPNEEEAARWFQKAADHDSPAGLYDLATLYESGRGVGKNFDKAKELYQKAANLGNKEAQKRLTKLGVPVKN